MANTFIIIGSILSVIGTLLPMSKSKHWVVRGQANFRAVYLFVNITLLIIVVISSIGIILKWVLALALVIAMYNCFQSILPYSPLMPKKISDAKSSNTENELSIVIHNVYQHNEKYDEVTKLVREENPDMVLLLETNLEWDAGVADLYKEYTHVLKRIQENTYGIILMSKYSFSESKVKNLVYDHIPSVDVLIRKNNRNIRLIGLHPEPPIPGEVLSSLPKEKEMLKAAEHIEDQSDEELTIVIGDLNDVAWSRISNKFKKITGLEDPREGRGFYSTFPTYSPIKIPLDHVFCSSDFKLVKFDTLEYVGSDHRPVIVKLKIPNL